MIVQSFRELKCLVFAYCRLQLVTPAIADLSGCLEHLGLEYNPALQLDEAVYNVLISLQKIKSISAIKNGGPDGGIWTPESMWRTSEVVSHFVRLEESRKQRVVFRFVAA